MIQIVTTLAAILVMLGGVIFAMRARSGPQSTLASAIVITGVLLTFVSMALARDDGRYANSALKTWFDSLRSGKGPCCSDADGYALSDVDWTMDGAKYRVRIPRSNEPSDKDVMIWIDVPDDAVITEPNRAGRTMVWPIWGYQGPSIRCFMPGSMT